jgi:hypothetical protein
LPVVKVNQAKTKKQSYLMKVATKFVFKTERSIRENHIEITKWQSADLRRKLPKGVFWLQIERGGLVQFNWILLNSYLLHGLDSPITQALVDEYMATLPQAA